MDQSIMKFVAVLLLFFTLAIASLSQDIHLKGKVLDQKSKRPLPFASVSIVSSSIGMMSNDSGEFELRIPENLTKDSLIVSYVDIGPARKKSLS